MVRRRAVDRARHHQSAAGSGGVLLRAGFAGDVYAAGMARTRRRDGGTGRIRRPVIPAKITARRVVVLPTVEISCPSPPTPAVTPCAACETIDTCRAGARLRAA